jgi:hypothetical protein
MKKQTITGQEETVEIANQLRQLVSNYSMRDVYESAEELIKFVKRTEFSLEEALEISKSITNPSSENIQITDVLAGTKSAVYQIGSSDYSIADAIRFMKKVGTEFLDVTPKEMVVAALGTFSLIPDEYRNDLLAIASQYNILFPNKEEYKVTEFCKALENIAIMTHITKKNFSHFGKLQSLLVPGDTTTQTPTEFAETFSDAMYWSDRIGFKAYEKIHTIYSSVAQENETVADITRVTNKSIEYFQNYARDDPDMKVNDQYFISVIEKLTNSCESITSLEILKDVALKIATSSVTHDKSVVLDYIGAIATSLGNESTVENVGEISVKLFRDSYRQTDSGWTSTLDESLTEYKLTKGIE